MASSVALSCASVRVASEWASRMLWASCSWLACAVIASRLTIPIANKVCAFIVVVRFVVSSLFCILSPCHQPTAVISQVRWRQICRNPEIHAHFSWFATLLSRDQYGPLRVTERGTSS